MTGIKTALVIGGGIAGPVTATALRKAGVDATVYEAYGEQSNGIGSALALAPNGLAALDVIGVGNAVRGVGFPIAATTMKVGNKDLGPLPSLDGVEPMYMLDRTDLHRVLRDHAAASGVRFEYGKRLTVVHEAADGITAVFDDGSTASADILVGGDGVRSTVRALIDPHAPAALFTGLLGFGGIVDADIDMEASTMTFAFGRRAYYLYWSMPDGRVAWGANLSSKHYMSLTEARRVPADDWVDTLRETYAGDDPGEALAQNTTASSLEVLGAIHIMPPVPHWFRGRMVLIGDAVHAPSNSTGQGASLAIESAVELARCVRDTADPETAFRTYEALRRRRVETIAKRGARINHSKTPGPIGRKVMSALMPLGMKLMNVEKQMGPEQRYVIDWDERLEVD